MSRHVGASRHRTVWTASDSKFAATLTPPEWPRSRGTPTGASAGISQIGPCLGRVPLVPALARPPTPAPPSTAATLGRTPPPQGPPGPPTAATYRPSRMRSLAPPESNSRSARVRCYPTQARPGCRCARNFAAFSNWPHVFRPLLHNCFAAFLAPPTNPTCWADAHARQSVTERPRRPGVSCLAATDNQDAHNPKSIRPDAALGTQCPYTKMHREEYRAA